MAERANGAGRRLNPTEAAHLREAEALGVQDKLDALIWLATPEEPRSPPAPEAERERAATVLRLEGDIPLAEEVLNRPRAGHPFRWLLVPGLLALVLVFIAVLGFALLQRDGATPAGDGAGDTVAEAGTDGGPAGLDSGPAGADSAALPAGGWGSPCPVAGDAVTVPWTMVDGAMRLYDGQLTIDAMLQPSAAPTTAVTIDPAGQTVTGSLSLPFERVPGSGIVSGDAAAQEFVEGTLRADYALPLSALPADGGPPPGYPPEQAYHWEPVPGGCVFSGPVDLDLSMTGYVATGVATWDDPPREEVTYGEAKGDIQVPAIMVGVLEPVDGGWSARLQVEFVSPLDEVPAWYASVHASHSEPIPGLG